MRKTLFSARVCIGYEKYNSSLLMKPFIVFLKPKNNISPHVGTYRIIMLSA